MRRVALGLLALTILAGAALAGGRVKQTELLPEELARKFVEAYNSHDVKAVMAVYGDSLSVVTPDLSVVSGKPANEKYYKAWFNSVPDIKSRIITLTTDGDRFVLECVETGTYSKRMPSAGSPSARKQKLNYPYVMIGKCKAGKITDVRIYENDLVVERQLGVRQ